MRTLFIVGGLLAALGALLGSVVVVQELNYASHHAYSELTNLLELAGGGLLLVGAGASIASFAQAAMIGRRNTPSSDAVSVSR